MGVDRDDVLHHKDALIGTAIVNGQIPFLKYLLKPMGEDGLGLTNADVRHSLSTVYNENWLDDVARHPDMVRYLVSDHADGGLGMNDDVWMFQEAAIKTRQLATFKLTTRGLSALDLMSALRDVEKARWPEGIEYLTTSKDRGGAGVPKRR
jgi:hypothetical protein